MSYRRRYYVSTCLAMLALILCAAQLGSCGYLIKPRVTTGIVKLQKGSYQLDPSHTSVLFKINHMGFSTYVGRFNQMDGQLEFDPHNMATAKLSAVITMASVDVNNTELEKTLRGDNWFATARYPQAIFTTQSVKLISADTADFTGNLQFHGVSAPWTLRVRFMGAGNSLLTGAYTLGFSAKGKIQRSAFGMGYLVPAIGDWVDIEVYAEFKKTGG